MQWFNTLRLSGKLLVSVAAVLVVTCVVGVLSIVRLSDVAAKSAEISGNYLPSLDKLNAINTVASNIRLRWEYAPGSELFIVYNEQRDSLARQFPDLVNRAFIVKVNRLVRF